MVRNYTNLWKNSLATNKCNIILWSAEIIKKTKIIIYETIIQTFYYRRGNIEILNDRRNIKIKILRKLNKP